MIDDSAKQAEPIPISFRSGMEKLRIRHE